MPQHIKGKVFLYFDLFKYYNLHSQKTKRNTLLLNEFLKLQGTDLFKYFFDLQKVRKNCILREIKPIYQNSKGQYKGIDVFNRDLLEYFESETSQISHLKYLLNRMNNEKAQFHSKNIETYEILVQAMQIKLVIGGPKDIPIQQVLVYIQNIPLNRKDSEVMAQLQTVQRINQQAERFREMKINMSIRQIIDKCEDVVSKLIEYEFKKYKVQKIKDVQELKKISYKILAEIQTVKQKIYGQEMSNLPFFIYICQILENEKQIDLANQLLKDQYLNRYFTINETIIQNLVLFMYKKRFIISAVFKDHQSYIRKIVTLLAENSSTRQFILSELAFALLLSAPGQGIEFPISEQNPYPKINELNDIVSFLPEQFILTVDIQRVYEQMKKMYEIEVNSQKDQSVNGSQIANQEFLSIHQVYQVFINRMIDLNLIHQVIPYIRKICSLPYPNQDYNTLYLIIMILKISSQLNDDCKLGLNNIVSYAFEDQQQIMKIIEFYVNEKMTSLQKGIHIRNISEEIKKDKSNYNLKGKFLFKDSFRDEISNNPEVLRNAKLVIETTWIHLRNAKEEFKDPFYEYCYIIVCHEPYLLAKMVYLLAPIINFKVLRSFISYLSQEELFDETKVLQFSKRVFYLVMESKIQNKEINHRLFSIQQVDFFEHVYFKDYFGIEDQLQIKIQKSFKACQNKSKILLNVNRSRKSQRSGDGSIQIKILHPQQISESAPSQYPFEDSDDDVDGQQKIRSNKTIRAKNKKAKIQFDQKSERNKFMNRQTKKLGNYLKEHTQTEKKTNSSRQIDGQSPRIKSRVIQDAPIIDKQMKLKKAMTLSYNPDDYRIKNKLELNISQSPKQKKKKMIMDIIQSPKLGKQDGDSFQGDSFFRKKQQKFSRRRQSFSFQTNRNQQNSFHFDKMKQKSNYGVNQNSAISERTQTCENILEDLFQQYDIETKTFNLQKLKSRSKFFEDEQAKFIEELKKIIQILYDAIDADTDLKTNLIKSISKVFPEVGLNQNSQVLYFQMISLLNRYNINISITKILPVQGLFMNVPLSKLFEIAKPNIIQLVNDQNLNKLSKVISLAFRKNQYEQQIAYEGLCKIVGILQNENLQQVQINLHFDQFQVIINKMSTKLLKQKSQKKFIEMPDGKLKQKFVEFVLFTIGKKGDKGSVDYIKKNMAKKINYKEICKADSYENMNIRVHSIEDQDE